MRPYATIGRRCLFAGLRGRYGANRFFDTQRANARLAAQNDETAAVVRVEGIGGVRGAKGGQGERPPEADLRPLAWL